MSDQRPLFLCAPPVFALFYVTTDARRRPAASLLALSGMVLLTLAGKVPNLSPCFASSISSSFFFSSSLGASSLVFIPLRLLLFVLRLLLLILLHPALPYVILRPLFPRFSHSSSLSSSPPSASSPPCPIFILFALAVHLLDTTTLSQATELLPVDALPVLSPVDVSHVGMASSLPLLALSCESAVGSAPAPPPQGKNKEEPTKKRSSSK